MSKFFVRRFICISAISVLLSGCAGSDLNKGSTASNVTEIPRFDAVAFDTLPGWETDNLQSAMQAFKKSCETLLKQPANRAYKPFGTVGDFHIPCQNALKIYRDDSTTLRTFFETWFTPYTVSPRQSRHDMAGLFTGYYEASLNGSVRRGGRYQTPIYAMPKDLYTADLGDWYPDLAGKKITAQTKDGTLGRYPARNIIEKEGLAAAEVLAWVDDAADAFFLQIQGSGVINMQNGTKMRVGFAGKNGHGYYAVGRALIERGALTAETVSLQSIRAWMQDHPQDAVELMNLNPSYVFFRKLDTNGPVGAQGVVLTPYRSLAVDSGLYSYGTPIWLRVQNPADPTKDIAQLMVAQDTGGAIKGVVRGDFFWGYGDYAEAQAGKMKSQGRYWFLMPQRAVAP